MALVDLSSDLSKFRSEVSREPKNTPEASKATNNKNFATIQPISAKLSQFSPTIKKVETKQLESKLDSTKFDDIRKFAQQNLLINSVSKYSRINEGYDGQERAFVPTQMISKKFGGINITEFSSKLTKSNTLTIQQEQGTNNNISSINVTNQQQGTYNTTSNILVNSQEQGTYNTTSNIRVNNQEQGTYNTKSPTDISVGKDEATNNIINPNIDILTPPQTFDRTKTSPVIKPNPNDEVDNVVNPNIEIVAKPQTFDRTKQSVKISKDLVSPINNITDPKTVLDVNVLTYERAKQTPTIITDIKQDGFVTDPKTKVFRFDNTTIQTEDNSRLNLDGLPLRFIPISKLDGFELPREVDVARYTGESQQTEDNSNLNLDVVVKPNPAGRNENPTKSKFSVIGTQAVNFFPDTNAKGFVVKQQKGQTLYTGESEFGWSGKRDSAPTTNFITDVNGKGFTKFSQVGETNYETESSIYGFTNIESTNFFDETKQFTSEGFKTFSTLYQSDYNPDSSQFTFKGSSQEVPVVNYFDLNGKSTTDGFTKFPTMFETKYIQDASNFVWKGARDNSPEVNYFDVDAKSTTSGFTKFMQQYESKYVPDSSEFDWDGKRQDSPEVNYFDITGKNTTAGFSKFPQLYESKYIADSSGFDWDGIRQDAPEVNYFDLMVKTTTVGFHKFAGLHDSKYIQDASDFDWSGTRTDSPETNFFDLNKQHQTSGFHRLAQKYDSKFIKDASLFDFDGNRGDAPEVNYFDLNGQYTTQGFQKFAQTYETKYIKDSSRFDFDGSSQSAPETDFFDITKKNTSRGFEKFPQALATRYIKDSSRFDFDGNSKSAPTTNFFQNTNGKGFTSFAQKLESEYVKESSEFTFKGGLPKAINFLDDTHQTGFINKTPLLESKFKKDVSKFTFKGTLPTPVDFLPNDSATGFDVKTAPLQTKYITDVSRFTFKGSRSEATTVDYFQNDVNKGFTKLIESLSTEYKPDISRFSFKGTRQDAPNVDYLQNTPAVGFKTLIPPLESYYKKETSQFTWNGSKQEAPEVDFFKIPGSNPNAISGFTKLFDDVSSSKLSDEFSRFSISSATNLSSVKKVPYTKFFGFNPMERSGFLVQMDNPNSSLYPLLDPRLTPDDTVYTRFGIEADRSKITRQKTTDDVGKYAPKTLGGIFWSDGTNTGKATLGNQVPWMKVKSEGYGSTYFRKYEKLAKDSTEGLGYLTKWANTRRSPSELDKQYSKYKLQDESTNREIAAFNQPFVVRGIQRVGEVENQRWGFGVTFDDGIVRGGVVTQAERIAMDVVRLGKWTASIKGGLFNVKQLGLQAMNPAVDVNPKQPLSGVFGVSSTLLFNPLTMLANVATARAGVHLARHGLFPFDSSFLNKYEDATVSRELNQRFVDEKYKSFEKLITPSESNRDPDGYNRLIGLMKELLPNSFNSSTKGTSPGISQKIKELAGISSISRISSNFGGAQSYFGIGGTTIRRASHPYLTNYTTSPTLEQSISGGGTIGGLLNAISQTQPQYLDSAKRDIYYAAKNVYGQQDVENIGEKDLKQLIYSLGGAKIKNEESNTGDISKVSFQNKTVEDIKKYNPFEPKYVTPADKFKKKTGQRFETSLNDGPNPYDVDADNPIKKYRVLAYNKLQKVRKGEAGRTDRFNDFRHDLELSGSETFISNPKVARYDTRNMEDFFGMGKQGKPGSQRNLPFVSNISYRASELGVSGSSPPEFKNYPVPNLKNGQEFRGDRINIIDYKRANFDISKDFVYEKGTYNDPNLPGAEDLVEFYFSGLTLTGHNYCPAEVIVFRATFNSISDNHKPSWSSVKYMGRADPLYVYQGYERDISFGFTVHIGSRDEMKASWRKLNYLASWTAPEYTKAGFIRGPLVRLNIGNLYRKMPGYISNLSYTFDNTQGNWETAKLLEDQKLGPSMGPPTSAQRLTEPGVLQLPKTVEVNCDFVPVGVYRPEFRGTMYSLYDDTNGGKFENGLIPSSQEKVNYFRTYDNIDITQNDNKFYLPVPFGEEATIQTQSGSVENLIDLNTGEARN